MSAKKKLLSTPLHLLEHLSHSLVEHLENACKQALADSEKLLAKLEKQRVKAQEKLAKTRQKLQDASEAGKAKAQAKAKLLIGELDEVLDTLKTRQTQTRTHIANLKRDVQESLKLAQGVVKVKEATSKSLQTRNKPTVSKAKPISKAPTKSSATAKPVRARAKPATVKPAAKAVSTATKPPAKTVRKPQNKAAAAKPVTAS